ncbi:MAG: hypothetical protein JWO08_4351 [Verrucomicrobiaceae bacterium]|nr:hypothetical protein [Verrucomicrobiaceae bacterium]
MNHTYRVTYWEDRDGARYCVAANEFPRIIGARRELRERRFVRLSGNAQMSELEEWRRPKTIHADEQSATLEKVGWGATVERYSPQHRERQGAVEHS